MTLAILFRMFCVGMQVDHSQGKNTTNNFSSSEFWPSQDTKYFVFINVAQKA